MKTTTTTTIQTTEGAEMTFSRIASNGRLFADADPVFDSLEQGELETFSEWLARSDNRQAVAVLLAA